MPQKIWLGNVKYAQWVPAPGVGMQRSEESYAEEITFTNGGLWINNTPSFHLSYDMTFPVQDSSTYDSIEAFSKFAAGSYGSDFIRFVDPMKQDQNLFTSNWAEPGLTEQGWKPIYDTTPTYGDTGANSYSKPLRNATYNITSTTAALPTGQNSVFTLLIPTGYTLYIGGSGVTTGTGVLRIQPINLNGTLAAVTDVTLIADSAAPSFSNTFNGNTYRAVRIYVTRTSTAASTITLTSLWAQVALNGVTANIQRHIPGKGHAGLKFRPNSRIENYIMQDRHLVGGSITLAEVEPWQ